MHSGDREAWDEEHISVLQNIFSALAAVRFQLQFNRLLALPGTHSFSGCVRGILRVSRPVSTDQHCEDHPARPA